MDFFSWGLHAVSRSTDCGLVLAVQSAIAVDEICSGWNLVVRSAPGYIILEGAVPTKVALRAEEVAREVAGNRRILDRMSWTD